MRVDTHGQSKLDFFKNLYEEAKNASNELYEKTKINLEQYKGSAEIDGSKEEAKQVRNITYELVESQVTSYIPTPAVTPDMWSERNERNAKSIETLLSKKRNRLPLEEMNDLDERFNPIYGGSVWLVEWDESITTHNTVGDVKLTCTSPPKFAGQPYIYSIDDMEYCFITFETTKEDIMRKYGVPLAVAEETKSDENPDDRTATLVVCYYKDDEDLVCQYIWSEDTELRDITDYYARKRYVCKRCGQRKELCSCENTKDSDYELMSEEYETLMADIHLSDGTVIPAMSEVIENGQVVMTTEKRQALDETGAPVFETIAGLNIPVMIDVQVPKLAPTKLPYYRPKKLPIVIRKNTSQEDSLFGQSDCDFIRPEQQGVNKMESRIMAKCLKAGVRPRVPDDYTDSVDNSLYDNPVRCRQDNYNLFGVIDTTVDISQDIVEAERLYDHAKRILGITDSFQGQHDSSAQSGVAKQLQIQQAQGRLNSKRQMKNAAYAKIDEIIFQYFLAYADEPRPSVYKDSFGRLHNSIFNRYDFIERDTMGEWYYNDQYLFATNSSVDVEQARDFLWQENKDNFKSGTFGDPALPETRLIYWLAQEKAHYPGAHENVLRISEEMTRAQQKQAAVEQGGTNNAY